MDDFFDMDHEDRPPVVSVEAGSFRFIEPSGEFLSWLGDKAQERAQFLSKLLCRVEEKTGVSFPREVKIEKNYFGRSDGAAIDLSGALNISFRFFGGDKRTETEQEFTLFHEASHILHADFESSYHSASCLFRTFDECQKLIEIFQRDPTEFAAVVDTKFPDTACFEKTVSDIVKYLTNDQAQKDAIAFMADFSLGEMLQCLTEQPKVVKKIDDAVQLDDMKRLAYLGGDLYSLVRRAPAYRKQIEEVIEAHDDASFMDELSGKGVKLKRVTKIRYPDGNHPLPKPSLIADQKVTHIMQSTLIPAVERMRPAMKALELYVRAIELRADMFAAYHMPHFADQAIESIRGNKAEDDKLSHNLFDEQLFPHLQFARTHPSMQESLSFLNAYMRRPSTQVDANTSGYQGKEPLPWFNRLCSDWDEVAVKARSI